MNHLSQLDTGNTGHIAPSQWNAVKWDKDPVVTSDLIPLAYTSSSVQGDKHRILPPVYLSLSETHKYNQISPSRWHLDINPLAFPAFQFPNPNPTLRLTDASDAVSYVFCGHDSGHQR